MTWIVEATDEFSVWFLELGAGVQDDIDRVVGLLEAKGPHCLFRFHQASRVRVMPICVSYASSPQVSPIGFSMLSIRGAPPFC